MRFAALAVILLFLGCGGSQQGSKGTGNDAIVFVDVEEPEAAIWVDGKFVAVAGRARGGVAVEPGSHRIEIRHDGYHTHYQLIDVAPKEKLRLDVELAAELP